MSRNMKYDKDRLIEDIVRMRIKELASTFTILEYIKKEANVAQTQAYIILKEAQGVISEMHKENRQTLFDESMAQMQSLLEDALVAGDRKLANDIRKEMNKVAGLYIDRVEHSGNITIKTEWGGSKDGEEDTTV